MNIRRFFGLFFSLTIIFGSVSWFPAPINAATTKTVTTTLIYQPGYYWCQHLDGRWSTYSTIDNLVWANDAGGEPQNTRSRTAADIADPAGEVWVDSDGNKYDTSEVRNIKRVDAKMAPQADPNIHGKVWVDNGQVIIDGDSGKGVYGFANTNVCGGSPGMIYPFPVIVYFQATVTIPDQFLGLEIDPTEKTLTVAQKQDFTVYANWNIDGTVKRFEVTNDKLVWSSDAPAKAPVDSAGTVTGVQATLGTSYATIKATFSAQNASVTAKVWVIDSGGDGGGTIYVRHMVRAGPAGSYTKESEDTIAVPSLPGSETVSADSSKGTIIGKSISYVSYSNTTSSGSSVIANLTSSQPKAYVTFFYEKASAFTGDFYVLPSTIAYRDSFTLHPKDFQLQGCTYISHSYKIERGSTWMSPEVNGQTTDSTYSQNTYPSVIGIGTHSVYMKIKTSCGESSWIGPKTLTVSGPTKNHPPQFKIAWVRPSEPTKPVYEVTKGTVLNLVVINDPSVPTPTDEDGDSLSFDQFFFADSDPWMQSLPSKYPVVPWGMYNITMDGTGFHNITAQIRDQWGATAQASTYINVIPDNPVPGIQCPPSVIENHPVPDSAFDASKSYSPLGRTINHSRDEWTNKLTTYTNGTNQDITVQVSLHVYDSYGLKSLNPATCSIIVKPDLPPIAKLDVPKLGIRNEPSVILNKSYSPDGDEIVAADYKYKYDAKNNGFADDAWQPISGGLDKFTINPAKVGKYLFYAKVTEAYGKWGDTASAAESTLTMDIVNNAPEVSFEVEGKNPQPDLNASTTIRPDEMINWPVYVPNSTEAVFIKSNLWRVDGGSLVGSDARNFGNQGNYSNRIMYYGGSYSWNFPPQQPFGFGANNLSPWRSASSFTLQGSLINDDGFPIKINTNPSSATYTDDTDQFKMRSNQKLFYFDDALGYDRTIYALDPKKLSPLVPVAGWQLTYKYRDGDPYVFRIKKTNSYITNWEIAGKYLYVLYTSTSNVTQLSIYDAFNGTLLKEIAQPYDLGIAGDNFESWRIAFAKGQNVVLRRGNYSPQPGQVFAQFLELSPNLTLTPLPSWKVPNPRQDYEGRPYYSARPYYTDPYGNVYTYEGFVSYNGSNRSYYDLSLNKYDVNLNKIWKTYLTAPGVNTAPNGAGTNGYNSSFDYNNFTPMEINTFAGEISVPVYEDSGSWLTFESIYTLNMYDGTIKAYRDNRSGSGTGIYSFYNHYINWNGTLSAGKGSVTADGSRTEVNYRSAGNYGDTTPCGDGIKVYNANGTVKTSMTACYVSYGQYVGDGFYVYISSDSSQENFNLQYARGTTDSTPLVRQTFTSGQFLSNLSLNDADIKFSLRMDDVDFDSEWMGFSFRMQDQKNRYAVETDGHAFNLVKYVNGVKSVLKTGSYAFESNKSYGVRIKMIGSQIDVFLNSIPMMTTDDSSYSEGKFGYFSNKAFVRFSALTYKAVNQKIEWSDSYAIWDEGTAKAEVAYNNIQFLDPEGDPKAGSYKWSIQHTPRFLNNQGLSAMNGQTFVSEQLTFDKVGDYIVGLQAQDDPNPSYLYPDTTFAGYRKNSNPFAKRVTVHRRPISNFTVASGGDGKVIWTDSSYDPDRYESATKYSTEATGIDYKTTRGVLEKKFYYTTPSGVTVYEKLVTPQEKGYYEIGMAVKDEYGAWSDYTVVSLDVTTIPTPNAPPVPGFTTNYVNTFRSVPITINSTAYDAEDGGRENLPHEYYIRNVTTGDGETLQSTSRTSWTKAFSSLGTFNIRQMVQDSAGAEAQFNRQVNIYNQIPNAQITVPASTDQNNPTKLTEFRPAFNWNYFDADGDVQSRYQLKIYKYGGVQYLDTDIKPGNVLSWRPSVDLPEHVNMYVMVRAYDGHDWGNWSNPKYFYIETNRPPTADFSWTPRPVYEGDTVMVTHAVDDLDKDPLSVKYVVTDPEGASQSFSYTLYNPYPAAGPSFKAAKAGTYQVELTVSDGKAPPVIVRKSIPVLPLMVSGQVLHTELWDLRRKDYNTNETGDPNTPRSYSVFWAGEKFVLLAQTTATGTATKADRVEVKMNSFSAVLAAGNAARTDWSGDMWDTSFETLADGPLTFTFTATYNNGMVKTENVTVTIAGNVQQTVGVHRRQ